MKKFEYKIIVLENNACFRPESKLSPPTKKDLLHLENNTSILNQLGNDGWELITLCPGVGGNNYSISGVLKREVTG